MHKNNNKLNDYSAVLDAKHGKDGTASRNEFEEKANAFYVSQIILNARKGENVTQKELADRLNVDKSYISRIEKGITVPNVGLFYKIMDALGLRIEISKAIG